MSKDKFPFKMPRGNDQRGFGMLSVLIGTVVLLGVTVAVVASTRGSIVGRDVSSAQASGVIGQANALLTAYETGVSRAGFTPATMAFTSASLYSPSITGLSELPLLPQAFDVSAWKQVRWQFGRAVAIKGFGTDSGAETAFFLVGVSQETCGAVNRAMTGSTEMGTAADTSTTQPPNAFTVTTVNQLFNASPTLPSALYVSTVHPVAPATPLILSIQDNANTPADVRAQSSIGCFRMGNGGAPVHVVYAIAQAS